MPIGNERLPPAAPAAPAAPGRPCSLTRPLPSPPAPATLRSSAPSMASWSPCCSQVRHIVVPSRAQLCGAQVGGDSVAALGQGAGWRTPAGPGGAGACACAVVRAAALPPWPCLADLWDRRRGSKPRLLLGFEFGGPGWPAGEIEELAARYMGRPACAGRAGAEGPSQVTFRQV